MSIGNHALGAKRSLHVIEVDAVEERGGFPAKQFIDLPNHKELERELLGDSMRVSSTLSAVLGGMRADDFSDIKHQELFRVMKEIADREEAVTLESIAVSLKDNADKVGGITYIEGLCEEPALTTFPSIVIKRIIEAARRCRVINILSSATKKLSTATSDEEIEIVEKVRRQIECGFKSNIDDNFIMKCLDAGEAGDSILFNEINSQRFIFDHSVGTWFRYDGQHWKGDIRNDVLRSGIDAVVQEYTESSVRQEKLSEIYQATRKAELSKRCKQNHESILKRVRSLQTLQRRKNVLKLASAGCGLHGLEWDKRPWLLPCVNAVVDLKTGDGRPGRPEDYIRIYAPTEWHGLDAPCPTWEKFISEICEGDPDRISFLGRLLGYGLIGEQSRHIFIAMVGVGRNGKGTLLETLKRIVGDFVYKAEAELLLENKAPRQSGSPNSAVLALRGKRFVFCSETNDGQRFNASRVKELTGGDTLNARPLYGKNHIEFQPSHTLFLMTNNRPSAPSGDYAFWKRMILMPFNLSYVDDPKESNERKADPNLSEKLFDEGPGILAWLVRGCLNFQKEGLSAPDFIKNATMEYQADEDLIGHFIKDRCFQGGKAEVKAGALYEEYREWAIDNGYKPMGNKRFGADIRGRGFGTYENRNTYFVGLGLLNKC